MLIGVEGAAPYLNDIIVVSQSKQELTEHINKDLICIQNFGFQLQPEKYHFYLYAIKYLGFIFDHQGCRADLANVATIRCMLLPSNVSSLCSFLELVSHYKSFLLLLRQVKSLFNKLLAKGIKWCWSLDC